ncbi:MAG: Cysteine desulfurase NifS [Candidatus Azambacteria bacterium GW2011_GWE1_42_9]|nr:MAG: Cysteine desulfurase NifS [Candidatus Azambacteria bacterium GW2011_GWF1_41_10]KKS49155.1 MAG: Cysteine desulfurase NifS [Candidatus Azambacteria bacterium GW2011_GWF2_42_22]KKS79719.1 MAG: Cysteine desulfurase NifS [Candidatus Azambacteria bacterium GW2011_GWE1_42_9]KKT03266.1 MAG: Cysteine desulfurase NifS [Candidatus Azambacteria bacterium GW2011_GWD1_43_18]KKT12657.1 MAG: Cysteine desulfurase NifS [Candidatus Azambacteria bacterium GW2011_GWC2_43_27]KKT17156.1 MAG: cysteine desulfu
MSKKNNKIYLDFAATTPVDREVLKVMMPYFSEKFGNASSTHSFGQEAIAAVDKARETIAQCFNCDFSEIIFTGSATEANNLAILGIVKNVQKFHIISTKIEHESVLEPLKELEKSGHEITYLTVDKTGLIKIADLEKAIKDNTILISVIYANNEIGTIQPIKEIGKLLEKINKKRKEGGLSKIYLHTDAVQAINYLECRPDWLKIDLLTFSGHKIYGPKGIGGLYIRKNSPLSPIIFGGGQEFGLRSGTENVASIVGLAKAVESAFNNKVKNFKKVSDLRNQMLADIIKHSGESAKLNGSPKSCLPNILSIRFSGLSNETLIVALDRAGVAVSAGAACSSRALAVSHVLIAIGLTPKQVKESIRISLGKDITAREIKMATEIINKTIQNLL